MRSNQYNGKYIKPKSRRPFPTAVLVVYLLVAAVLTTGVSFSRYSASASGNDSASVAKFSVSDDLAKQSQTISIQMAPGDQAISYPITITNDSEVAVKYTLRLDRETENLPLDITIPNEGTGVIAAGAADSTEISAEISWQTGKTDHRYSHEIDLITVNLTVEQVD